MSFIGVSPSLLFPARQEWGYRRYQAHEDDQDLEHLLYEDRLRTLGLFSLEKRSCVETSEQLPGSEGGYKDAGEGLFIRDCSNRTRGDGFKLKQGKFRLDIRRKFFTVRVVRHWNGLPKEVVNAPSLAVFKAGLNRALGDMV